MTQPSKAVQRKILQKEPAALIACSICERRQEGGKEAFTLKGKLVCVSCVHALTDIVLERNKDSE